MTQVIFLGAIHAIRFDSEGACKVVIEVPASDSHKVALLTQMTKTVLTFTIDEEETHAEVHDSQ